MKRTQLDPTSRADAALDQVVALQAEIDALHARRTEALNEFRETFAEAYPSEAGRFERRAMNAELACALRVPERTAERLMGEARALVETLPATLGQLADGLFSYRHAQVMIDQTAGLSPEDVAAVERVALGSAKTQTVSRFARTVRTLRERRDPSTMVDRVKAAHTERAVTFEPAQDGMGHLNVFVGAVDGAAIFDRLSGAAYKVRADGDSRTIAQLRADLLTDKLLDRDTTTAAFSPSLLELLGDEAAEILHATERDLGVFDGIVPTVIVTVPVQTLLGGDEPATLDGVGPIDAATARRLTAHAPSLYRLLTHPETGAPLSLGRTSYQLSEGLRKWLRIRDGSCRFPMCAICTRRSDIDHTVDWARGGETNHDNLAHLSRGHHTLKHHGGWRVEQRPGGRLIWTSYLGRRYETAPEVG